MEIKSKNQTDKKYPEIVSNLAISFFFAIFFLTILLITFKSSLDQGLSLIDGLALDSSLGSNENVKINPETKELLDYPAYGKEFATLKIPSIKLEYPIYHGDTLDILRKGIGHYAGSFFPGEGGSIILAAHNNVHFQNLYDIKKKAIITIETIYGTFTYKVTKTKVISDNDEKSLPINKDSEILMMYTCYPRNAVGHASKRYVVYAKLESADYEKVKEN